MLPKETSESVVRPYETNDADAVCSVIKTVFEEFGFPWLPNSANRDCYAIEKHYHERGGGFWVVEVNGEVVGTCGYIPHDNKRCELLRMYLLPQFRGQGLGKKIFNAVAKDAFSRGFLEMEIWSDKVLITAHNFYRSIGAIPIGERVCKDSDSGERWEEWGFLLDLKDYLR
ncbi:MAG TPA: GNAT family N-acetyltransferase [Fimbriimonadales bacterium]|nr:GNAT family N-acetyltransferase [Fimbriimonadales bacterium]